jgi:hypothetical protein
MIPWRRSTRVFPKPIGRSRDVARQPRGIQGAQIGLPSAVKLLALCCRCGFFSLAWLWECQHVANGMRLNGSGMRDMQSSEMMRNSLGLNDKSAALDQLSYPGISHTKAVFSELIKSSSVTERCTRQFQATGARFARRSDRKDLRKIRRATASRWFSYTTRDNPRSTRPDDRGDRGSEVKFCD